jgi:osmotically-inducible protein OsmY
MRIPAVQSMIGNVDVAINGQTAVLTGAVSTPAERERIERLARLEPGIYSIDNRITVTGQ